MPAMRVRERPQKARPVIVGELHLHVRIGQQAHVIEQLARRNRAGAFLFDARRARAADAQFQIRGGQQTWSLDLSPAGCSTGSGWWSFFPLRLGTAPVLEPDRTC